MKDAIARGMEWYIFKLEFKGHNITHTNNNRRYSEINKVTTDVNQESEIGQEVYS